MEVGGRVWKGNTLRHLHNIVVLCPCVQLSILPSILLPPTSCCLFLSHCRTDRKIHDKNGEIILLQNRIAELEEDMEQERREMVNLRERLCLRRESLQVQQQQRQQAGSEGSVGRKVVRGDV